MRRADRLFEIIQLMRRQKLVRARDLAEKLEVSERTIYRDVRDLMASRVPIEGEAGVGYALRQGYDLPPLMFDEHEIEALVLGARIVQSWTDAKLADAAGNVIAKVEAVIPERLRQHMADTALLAPSRHRAEPITVDASELRRALRRRLKIHLHYRDSEERPSARVVRPLALFFYGPVWLLAAWCELRQDFRSFRLDRMSQLDVLDERFARSPARPSRIFSGGTTTEPGQKSIAGAVQSDRVMANSGGVHGDEDTPHPESLQAVGRSQSPRAFSKLHRYPGRHILAMAPGLLDEPCTKASNRIGRGIEAP